MLPALEHLERQGYCCYLPTSQIEKLRLGRKRDFAEPLFPRYLFVRLNDVETNWHPIRSTRGVEQLINCKGRPLRVREEIIRHIQERVSRHEMRIPYLQAGERVRITEGAFAQLEAIFLASDGDNRVVLLMNFLQKEQELTFPLKSVRKIA